MKTTKKLMAMAACAVMTVTSMVGMGASATNTYYLDNGNLDNYISTYSNNEANVSYHAQIKTNWCWAAAGQMLLEFFSGQQVSQYTVVSNVTSGSMENVTASASQLKEAMNYIMSSIKEDTEIKNYFSIQTSNISWTKMNNAINGSGLKPIAIKGNIYDSNGDYQSSHYLVAYSSYYTGSGQSRKWCIKTYDPYNFEKNGNGVLVPSNTAKIALLSCNDNAADTFLFEDGKTFKVTSYIYRTTNVN